MIMKKEFVNGILKNGIWVSLAFMIFIFFIPNFASAHENDNNFIPPVNETTTDENTIFGDIIEITEPPINPDLISPYYIPCSLGGRHNMVGNGTGYVWNPNTKKYLLSKGQCSRCNKCSLIIISTYNPFAGHRLLGYYSTGSGPANSLTILYQTYGLSFNSKLGNDSFTQSLAWGK